MVYDDHGVAREGRIEDDMQTGELVVARLKGGAGIGRCMAMPATAGRGRGRGQQVRISVGRNRVAEVPTDRVILSTGIIASAEEEVEEFRTRCEELSSQIDLAETWELVRQEDTPMSLDALAELYWGSTLDTSQKVALLLHLEGNSLYFINDEKGYLARPQEDVQEIQTRRQRQAENAHAAASLMEHLAQGRLPPEITDYQSALLDHLRGYAVHGEDFTRSATVRSLLESVETGARDPQQLSFELLRQVGIFSPDEPLELERAGIAEKFSKDTLAEADAIDLSRALEEPYRRDLASIPSFTIDDAGTEDRDDALSLDIETSPELPSAVYRLGVHIADAGALIPLGGALDREADRRMGTLYMPDRKVTMLPPEVSERTGSLLPEERRVALSLLVRITESGEILDWEMVPSVVRSQAALSYDEADRAIGDADRPWHRMLTAQNRIAQSLRQKREKAGAISLDGPEMVIKVTASGEVELRVVTRATSSRRMVAEFMILCNSLMAEFCRREKLPAAYRSQTLPELGDLMAEVPEGPLRRYLIIRRLPPADLDIIPAAHGGLGVDAYIQGTSPLRRYPDLVMQRQISHFLATGQPLYSPEAIASVAQRADVQLRELARLEEDRRRYWFLKFLKQSLSDREENDDSGLYEAVALENRPGRHALLELADYPFRFRADLPKTCAPGDPVTLRLHGVDLWRRSAQFVHEPRD